MIKKHKILDFNEKSANERRIGVKENTVQMVEDVLEGLQKVQKIFLTLFSRAGKKIEVEKKN